MRIGIDAGLLSDNKTGLSRYIEESLQYLVKSPGQFHVYCGRSIDNNQWSQKNTFIRAHRSHISRHRLRRMLWTQSCLPYWSRKDRLDVFWGPTHRLPYFLPSNVARVVTIHDLVWQHAAKTMRSLSNLVEAIFMPQAIKASDIVVAVSKSTAHDISAAFPESSHKIRVIYPGRTFFSEGDHSLRLAGLKIPSPYILFVGTMEPRKNLRGLLKAFAMLEEANKNISLVIAGGKGWGDVNIVQWVKEFGLTGKVYPVGYVTDQQLAALYANTLFLAMPSLYEGFGLPIIEAMSFGKPVLTSNVSSMPEVTGKAGVLADPHDEHAIALGLKTLLGREARRKLEAEAKQNAERFTWQANAEQLWDVFQEAISLRKKAR